MKLMLKEDNETEIENSEDALSNDEIACKFCKAPINLTEMRQLPKKLIIEKHGLCWTGLEKVFLIIHKVQCQSCKKKYSHKSFKSEFIYK
ncbi:MAG: hypothetical protein ACON35_05425 [Candidatus Marinamargulisbacteria bacterium]